MDNDLKRTRAMIYRFKRGQTLQEVGFAFGVSRERVRQLLNKAGVFADEGGRAVKSQGNRARMRSLLITRINRLQEQLRSLS